MIPNKLTDKQTNRLTNSHSKYKAMLIKLSTATIRHKTMPGLANLNKSPQFG
jgi:hypothetical protein